ncbi:MAG TPA: hypothetical protein VFN80_08420 [Acidothermaceae bacterium]|nr:hypothetical protein [Acidothermaceae bacterium]
MLDRVDGAGDPSSRHPSATALASADDLALLPPDPLPRLGLSQRARLAVVFLSDHAWLVTLSLATVVALVGFRGGDFPAQDYRAWVFRTHGFLIWDVNWYGGHADLGYSVLAPVVGAVLGTVPTIALACVLSTILFGRLVGRSSSWACVASRLWFAVFVVGDLIIGRGPFACSVTFALATVLMVRHDERWLALAAAMITSLFSPLGALFLLLVAAAWLPSIGWRRAMPFAGAFTGLAIAALLGDGGRFPFPWTAFVGQLAIVGIGFVVTPRHERNVRRALLIYGVVCVGLFAVPNPVGGNMARFAGIVIGPAAAFFLLRNGRVRGFAVVALPLFAFQLQPIVTAVVSAAGDLSTKPFYYQGVTRFLVAHQKVPGKVEIPFTKDHWEATYVAESVPLARGWDRQVDLSRNAVLYSPLTPAAYEQWLHDNAVRYVALPDAPLDEGGQAEADILRTPPSWLKQVYADQHWKIWKVADPTPMATGADAMTQLAHNGFTLTGTHPGVTTVRLRWSSSWRVTSGDACLAEAPGGWTTVVTFQAGVTKVSAQLSLGDSDQCTDAQLSDAGAPKPPSHTFP